jgi:hypothetical protein
LVAEITDAAPALRSASSIALMTTKIPLAAPSLAVTSTPDKPYALPTTVVYANIYLPVLSR